MAGKGRLTCKTCGAIFDTLPEIRKHYLDEHPDVKGTSESARRQRAKRREERAAPPRAEDVPRDTAPRSAPPPPTSGTPRAGTLERRLLDFFGLVALLPSMLGDQVCTQHLIASAPTLAQVWAKAATEHKWLQEAIEKLLSASTLTAALGTTAMTLYPVLVHHGMAPALAIPHAAKSEEQQPTEGEGARGIGLVG